MNPTIDDAFLASERARDPDGFAAEYEARFEGSGAAFSGLRALRDRPAPGSWRRRCGAGWIAGLDPAFSSDPFGVSLVGRDRRTAPDGARPGAGVACGSPRSFEERRQVEDELLGNVIDVCRRYRAVAVTDQYAARAWSTG